MTELSGHRLRHRDTAPGDEPIENVGEGLRGYLIGLGLSILLTAVAFFIARTTLVWQPCRAWRRWAAAWRRLAAAMARRAPGAPRPAGSLPPH